MSLKAAVLFISYLIKNGLNPLPNREIWDIMGVGRALTDPAA